MAAQFRPIAPFRLSRWTLPTTSSPESARVVTEPPIVNVTLKSQLSLLSKKHRHVLQILSSYTRVTGRFADVSHCDLSSMFRMRRFRPNASASAGLWVWIAAAEPGCSWASETHTASPTASYDAHSVSAPQSPFSVWRKSVTFHAWPFACSVVFCAQI